MLGKIRGYLLGMLQQNVLDSQRLGCITSKDQNHSLALKSSWLLCRFSSLCGTLQLN